MWYQNSLRTAMLCNTYWSQPYASTGDWLTLLHQKELTDTLEAMYVLSIHGITMDTWVACWKPLLLKSPVFPVGMPIYIPSLNPTLSMCRSDSNGDIHALSLSTLCHARAKIYQAFQFCTRKAWG